MLTKLAVLDTRFNELEAAVSDPNVIASSDYTRVLREHARVGRLANPYRALRQALADAEAARELLADPDMKEMAEAEISEREAAAAQLEEDIKGLLAQDDPMADRPALLEIRAGTGGDEACLFAGDLARMYQMYCTKMGWSLDVMDLQENEEGGIKEGVFMVKGDGAYGLLRFESGGHRVQRVPATESQGRIHTSAATVAVMPEAEEVDVDINPADLRVDTYRASGAGGQHVNKTESAVRITHEPSGLVAACQDEKSQHSNRDRAMKVLRAKLYDHEQRRLAAERAAERKQQVGTGDRSDRIRTYNFPQNRITDHRIGFTAYNLDRYVEGNIDELQQAMIDDVKSRILDEWDGAI
ncbi:MAG: peptide chain release factor 1 [Planctomycetota bacterium]|nr:peptide chain release factor 1 [Planctomycetota bacterium]